MKRSVILLSLFFSLQSFAQTQNPPDAPVQPTRASQPIPKLSETQNTDTVLTEKVQAAIAKNSLLKNQAVSAASLNHEITLQGSVESKEQEKEAIKVAKSIPGVTEVNSQLTIKATSQ